MNNSKLLLYLETLSSGEMKEWGKFLDMNAAKNSNDAQIFFEYLSKQHPVFPEKKMRREVIAKKLFPKDAKNVKKVENIMYKFWPLLEEYLIFNELKNEKKERNFLLLKALSNRELDKFFFKKIDEMENAWQKKPPQGIEHLHDIYRLKKIRLAHPHFLEESMVAIEPKNIIEYLDLYYFATKMYWTLVEETTNKYVGKNEDDLSKTVFPVDSILQFIKEKKIHQVQIQLLFEILEAYKEGIVKDPADLKEQFINSFELYAPNEQIDVATFLTQIFYHQYRSGETDALKTLFELNKFGVEKNIFLSGAYISSDLFLNIINIACANNEWIWANEFIDKYQNHIEAEKKEDLLKLSKSIVYFSSKKYEKVLDELTQLKFKDVFFGLQGRAIKLKAFYELEEYEELFYDLCKSFRLFLYRNEYLADGHKNAFGNFIQFVKKLQKTKNEYKADASHIKEELETCQEIVYKTWLMEKVNLLIK